MGGVQAVEKQKRDFNWSDRLIIDLKMALLREKLIDPLQIIMLYARKNAELKPAGVFLQPR